ncbi:MAG: NAD(+)/NADH kinase [Clostridia bacterium]|nr:NAD(+)/NADH kinase [Clostridia bacterium]
MKRVAIITNFNITEKAYAAITVAQRLISHGCEVVAAVYNRERFLKMAQGKAEFLLLPIDEVYATAEMIVVLGGDGSILEAARRSASRATPILGINLGRLGFMAELEMRDVADIDKLFEPDGYTLEKRSMLNVELIGSKGNLRSSCYALNDASISNGSIARIVDLELSEGGIPVTSYRADGLIVATPTGSTAYSMSAGGSIVDPRVSCFCVTPICPHSLAARPMIFPDSAILEIKNICQREKMLYLTVDGRTNYEMYKGDVVRISKSPLKTNLVRIKNCGFYKKLRQKMTENE